MVEVLIPDGRSVDEVIITGDFLRPPLGSQDENIRWMLWVLGPAIVAATGLPVRSMQSHLMAAETAEAYHSYHLTQNTRGWAAIYNQDPNNKILEILSPRLRNAAVLAFECPPIVADAVKALGLPLIEIVVHPIRFFTDLLLAFRASHAESQERLWTSQIPKSDLRDEANRMKGALAGHRGGPNGEFSLITVQSPFDSSVVHEGHFAALPDFSQRIEDFRDRSQDVFIKPHPYAGIAPDVQNWAAKNGIQPIRGNYYELLASPHIREVLSLSSSTLDEADAFGIRTDRLLPEGRQFTYLDSPDLPGGFRTVLGSFSSPRFWANAFACLLGTREPEDFEDDVPYVNLRRSRSDICWDWRPDLLAPSAAPQNDRPAADAVVYR